MGKHLSPSSSEIALPRRAERLKKCPVIRVKLSGSSTAGFANDLGDAEQALDPKQLAGAIGRLGPPNPRRRCRSRWQSTLSAPGPPHVRWLAEILASVLCMAYTARPELCKAEGSCSTS